MLQFGKLSHQAALQSCYRKYNFCVVVAAEISKFFQPPVHRVAFFLCTWQSEERLEQQLRYRGACMGGNNQVDNMPRKQGRICAKHKWSGLCSLLGRSTGATPRGRALLCVGKPEPEGTALP